MKAKTLFSFILVAIWFSNTIANPTNNASKTLKVDVLNSKLLWKGRKHNGNVSVASGALVMLNDQLKGGGFDVDLKSITIANQAENAVLLEQLKGNDFFAVDKYPKATVAFTNVMYKGGDNYEVKGKLTVKGITKEVVFPAIVRLDKGKYTTQAQITIEYSNYGIKYHGKNILEDMYARFLVKNLILEVNLISA